jgi:hypothetical protein
MDIARWGLGVDALPERVVSCGGRLGYDDDGDTPNTQITLFDWGDRQLLFEVRGLPTPEYRDTKIGVVFDCEDGYLVTVSQSKVVAFDRRGAVVRTFEGDGDHYQDFLDAIKSGRREDLAAESLEGHLSSALCHLGNISYRLGEPQRLSASDAPFGDADAANEAFARCRDHLVENGLEAAKTDYVIGPSLAFDSRAERFAGDRSAEANALLTREYREPFVIPAGA